jgi:hypothetical protein
LGVDLTGFSSIKRAVRTLLFSGLCATLNAHAYSEGGHYYTLLALFNSNAKTIPPYKLSEMKLEALCTELPDMAQEFDAVTQRVHVLQSRKDNLWGLLGQCQTTVSSHMVASQYYLHALSGAPANRIRNAAKAIVKSIDDDLAKLGTKQSQQRRNLICARGLAAHLYGDTFAHVKLSSEKSLFSSSTLNTEMYETGLGHARDGHNPDYLYGHNINIDKWPQWAQDASANIATGSDATLTLNAHQPCRDTMATCEEPARLRLQDLVIKKELMLPDMPDRIASGKKGIGGMERSTSCDDVVNSALPNSNERPQCDLAWKNYLEKAIPIFYSLDIDPTVRPRAMAGKSCSAWQCTGSSSYNNEAASACTISDELRFGREQP